jgi:hypothetical protein
MFVGQNVAACFTSSVGGARRAWSARFRMRSGIYYSSSTYGATASPWSRKWHRIPLRWTHTISEVGNRRYFPLLEPHPCPVGPGTAHTPSISLPSANPLLTRSRGLAFKRPASAASLPPTNRSAVGPVTWIPPLRMKKPRERFENHPRGLGLAAQAARQCAGLTRLGLVGCASAVLPDDPVLVDIVVRNTQLFRTRRQIVQV